jgi:hypothetical protein
MVSGENSETDPEVVRLRTDTDIPPIRLADSENSRTESDRRNRRSPRPSHVIVDDHSRTEELVIADSVDEGRISSFLSATDFDSETLYIETRSVEECFRLRLCGIAWDTDEILTGYVRQSRPYDEPCSVDRAVFETRIIRIPAALDRDDINSYGSSTSAGGRCHEDRGTATEKAGGSDASTTTVEHIGGGTE